MFCTWKYNRTDFAVDSPSVGCDTLMSIQKTERVDLCMVVYDRGILGVATFGSRDSKSWNTINLYDLYEHTV